MNSIGWVRQNITPMISGAGRHSLRSTRFLALEPLENRQVLAAAFFAPAELAGSVNVQLVPLANVAAGVQETVTFGVPFTRGSLSQSQLSQVRVLKNGTEIPAFVEQLTPWRSIDNPSIDGQSVRVARIQIPYTFASLNPESITVQWGGPVRTLNRTTLQDPRLEWHPVTNGTFVAGDNVEEPDVLPVLPGDYLAKGVLDARTQPFASAVAETRDDPAVMDAMTFTGYTEYDYAEKNFFYTTINQNPGITINYKTQSEPWLYDRSSAMYELYLRSGFPTALREAIRSTDFYADHLTSSGFFSLQPGDPKLAYNESLAYTYWLLGDNRMLAPISSVVNAHAGTPSRWSPSLGFWTERNVGYKLLATEIAYEVTGNTAFKTSVQTIVSDLVWHQNGANGQLPANRINGALYHTGGQHDASEVSNPSVIIASSWMSALVVDPMVRAYGVWENPQITDFIVRMGNFENAASKTDAGGQFGGTTRYPDYLMRADGTSENRSSTDVQHAIDVGAVAAWATYFAELRGTPDASLRQLANDLYATYDVGVNFWTRPGSTNFNVSPPRRYAWEYKNSPSFSWALTGTDTTAPQPGVLQFSSASYVVNENQGSIAISVTRSGGSKGAVSVNYATSNGTATAGSDYSAASGTLTFAEGETSKSFTIPIINDTLVEGNETVTLTLSSPTSGATLGSPATATLTIASDDVAQPGVFQFSAPTYSVNETQSTASITVTRTSGSNVAASVNYATTSGTATAGSDYSAVTGTLSFAVGETSKTFSVPIINDTTVESAETVTLVLSNPTGGATLGSPATATLTINSDDTNWQTVTATYQQGVNGYTGTTDATISTQYAQYNGGNGTTYFNSTILHLYHTSPTNSDTFESLIRFSDLGIPTNATVSSAALTLNVSSSITNPTIRGYYLLAPWSGTPGTNATQLGWMHRGTGQDWASPGANGQGTDIVAGKSFVLPGIINGGQTITVALNPAVVQSWINSPSANQGILLVNETTGAIVQVGASENTNSASRPRLSITYADDAPGTLQFSNASYAVNENQRSIAITVTRSGGSSGPISVNYATSNGTATAGSDYSATSGTLTFADGETSKSFPIPILNDTLVEGNETVTLTLSSPSGGASLGSPATATLTIASDDLAQPGVFQFSAAVYSVNETQSTASITVTRTAGSNVPASVSYATSNGTAVAGEDYTAAAGILTFGVGETSKTFAVPIINDTAAENAETVSLVLDNPTSGATLGSPATATLSINSDDASAQPADVTSIRDGSWSDPLTWGGAVPQPGQSVSIQSHVTADVGVGTKVTVEQNGRLTIAGSLNLSGSLIVFGTLDGNQGQISFRVSNDRLFTGNTGPGPVAGEPDFHPDDVGLWAMPGSRIDLQGSPVTSWLDTVGTGATQSLGYGVVAQTAIIGGAATLAAIPTGWQPGDQLLLVSEKGAYARATLVSTQGSTIRFSGADDFQANVLQSGGYIVAPKVANLSRRLSIVAGDVAEGDTNHRAHVVIMHGADADFENVEFRNLGPRGKLGRYPVHFHHGGASDSSLIGSSIWQSVSEPGNRFVALHHVQGVVVRDNVAFNSQGNGYFFEDGSEYGNTLVGNLSVAVQRTEELRVADSSISPDGHHFWARAGNTIEGNVAAGGSALGMIVLPSTNMGAGTVVFNQQTLGTGKYGAWAFAPNVTFDHLTAAYAGEAGFAAQGSLGQNTRLSAPLLLFNGIGTVSSSAPYLSQLFLSFAKGLRVEGGVVAGDRTVIHTHYGSDVVFDDVTINSVRLQDPTYWESSVRINGGTLNLDHLFGGSYPLNMYIMGVTQLDGVTINLHGVSLGTTSASYTGASVAERFGLAGTPVDVRAVRLDALPQVGFLSAPGASSMVLWPINAAKPSQSAVSTQGWVTEQTWNEQFARTGGLGLGMPAGSYNVELFRTVYTNVDGIWQSEVVGLGTQTVSVAAGRFNILSEISAATESESAGPFPWHNSLLPADVNGDGTVVADDALSIINALNADLFDAFPAINNSQPKRFYDVVPDNFLAPDDALAVINLLNAIGASSLPEGMPADVIVDRATASEALPMDELIMLLASDTAAERKRSDSFHCCHWCD